MNARERVHLVTFQPWSGTRVRACNLLTLLSEARFPDVYGAPAIRSVVRPTAGSRCPSTFFHLLLSFPIPPVPLNSYEVADLSVLAKAGAEMSFAHQAPYDLVATIALHI